MIRLSALQTVGGEIRGWCRTTLPLLICFRLCISKELHYLALFWIGWKILVANSSTASEYLGSQRHHNPGNNPKMNKVDGTFDRNERNNTIDSAHSLSTEAECTQQPQHCHGLPHSIMPAGASMVDNHAIPKKAATKCVRQRSDPFSMFPSDVWVQHIIGSFLHPRDVTAMAGVSTTARYWADHPTVWKHLWLRDYGQALLQWHISCRVMEQSLTELATTELCTAAGTNQNAASISGPALIDKQSVEERLSAWLERQSLTNWSTQAPPATSTTTCSTKRFYFVFGEIYVNYLLAGYNTKTNSDDNDRTKGCFIGLHGHIFDFGAFSQYHPGLVEPILLECGRDATAYFEDIPHSRVARDLARRLCILANPACVSDAKEVNSFSSHGLRLCSSLPGKDLTQVFERSNTRPQPLKRPNYLLPDKTSSPCRRPPTLAIIREEWDEALGVETRRVQEEEQLRLLKNPVAAWRTRTSPPVWRIYYDPFLQVWKKWDAAINR